MSIAFSAVLIFLIFAPGAILRRSYLSGRFSKKFIYSTALDEIVWAIVPGTLLHLLMLFVVQQFSGYRLDFATLGFLLVGTKEDANTVRAFQVLGRDIWLMANYNLILWVFAAALGHGSRLVVRAWRLDKKFEFLRFNNEWYYLLTGELIENTQSIVDVGTREIDYVWIDALVGTPEGSILYSGILYDFYLSRTGGLESLYLTQVARRKIIQAPKESGAKNQGTRQQRYYDVLGDLFVIKYAQVVNINISYISVEEEGS